MPNHAVCDSRHSSLACRAYVELERRRGRASPHHIDIPYQLPQSSRTHKRQNRAAPHEAQRSAAPALRLALSWPLLRVASCVFFPSLASGISFRSGSRDERRERPSKEQTTIQTCNTLAFMAHGWVGSYEFRGHWRFRAFASPPRSLAHFSHICSTFSHIATVGIQRGGENDRNDGRVSRVKVGSRNRVAARISTMNS